MLRHVLTVLFAVVCALHWPATALRAAEAIPENQPLPRDPDNTYGQFDNGLKYIVRKNANPPGKVSFNLHIKTGALNEAEQQNGLAHFIEHMAFNGSRHYKPGELVPLLNRLGMSFGADTNAHTNLQETVYKLTMPDNKPETLDIALTVFSDYAGGLDFKTSEIDSERGVILEEMRARKSVAQRLRKIVTRQLFAGTRLAVHDVIGDEEQIKSFPQSEFQDYWNAWYRPELMTLVVVGDVNPDDVIARAKDKLGGVTARAPAHEALKAGLKPFTEPRAFVFTDPEQVGGEVELVMLKPPRELVTTYGQYRREFIEGVSEWIVNRRLADAVRKGGAPFRRAGVNTGDYMHEAYMAGASAAGDASDWNGMLDALIAEINRAMDYGFTPHELELAKRAMLAGAERAVKTESSRDSRAIVAMLSSSIGLDRPMMSAQQRLDLTNQIVADLSTDALLKFFSENFKLRNYAYVVTLPPPKGDAKLPEPQQVLAAASAAWMKKTQPLDQAKLADSILPAKPDAGTVVSQETDQALGVTTATFANGVVMHHKFSDYKKDQVSVRILMPGGSIEETADNKGISEVASLMVGRAATSRFTSTQIRDLMVGKNVSVGGGIGLDTLSIGVSGSAKDLPVGMQLAHAILTDGVLEQSALDDWKKLQLQALSRRKTSAQAKLGDAMSATFYGNDVRLTPLTEPMINRQERSPAEAWFRRIANHAAIEVSVVGDIESKSAIDLVAQYVGSLPKRTGNFTDLDKLRTLKRDSGPYAKTLHFEGVTPKAVVLAGFASCDVRDPERRPLSLAGMILTDRMIKRLREKEQLVYGIGCRNSPATAIPGTGTFTASAPTDPHNADKLADEILAMMQEFAESGPTDEELATAKKQIANQLVSEMKEPSFWMSQLDDLNYRGRSLDEVKQLPDIYQTFTAQQLRDSVRKYAIDKNRLRMVVIPSAPATTVPATQSAELQSVQQ